MAVRYLVLFEGRAVGGVSHGASGEIKNMGSRSLSQSTFQFATLERNSAAAGVACATEVRVRAGIAEAETPAVNPMAGTAGFVAAFICSAPGRDRAARAPMGLLQVAPNRTGLQQRERCRVRGRMEASEGADASVR